MKATVSSMQVHDYSHSLTSAVNLDSRSCFIWFITISYFFFIIFSSLFCHHYFMNCLYSYIWLLNYFFMLIILQFKSNKISKSKLMECNKSKQEKSRKWNQNPISCSMFRNFHLSAHLIYIQHTPEFVSWFIANRIGRLSIRSTR